MKHKSKGKKGFTLVELLIVIVIIGILFVVLISKVNRSADKAKIAGVKTDFRSFYIATEAVAREYDAKQIIDPASFLIALNENLDQRLKFDASTYSNGVTYSVAKDPWGQKYILAYTCDATKDNLVSVMYASAAGHNQALEEHFDFSTFADSNAIITLSMSIRGGKLIAAASTDTATLGDSIDNSTPPAEDEEDDSFSYPEIAGLFLDDDITNTTPYNPVNGEGNYISWDDLLNKYELDMETDVTCRSGDGTYSTEDDSDHLDHKNSDLYSILEKYNWQGTLVMGGGVERIGTYACVTPRLHGIYIHSDTLAIGNRAFYDPEDHKLPNITLKEAHMANGLITVGDYAFCACEGLSELTLSNKITSIGQGAFSNTAITELKIPASVTIIKNSAFFNTAITELKIPAGVTTIEGSAFSGCQSLSTVSLPDSISSLGGGCFSGCQSLTTVSLSDSISSLEWGCFWGCKSLETVKLPSNLESIGQKSFADCINLKKIDLPSNLKTIDDEAFFQCRGLKSIEIPKGVTNIGRRAFSGCTNLQTVSLPSSLKSIGSDGFYKCSSLQSIEIPEGITSVESEAFYECTNLTTVKLPSSLKSIGFGTFSHCSELNSIEIPKDVTTIENFAFAYCSKIECLQVPNNVTSIGSNAFYEVKEVKYNGPATDSSNWGASKVTKE